MQLRHFLYVKNTAFIQVLNAQTVQCIFAHFANLCSQKSKCLVKKYVIGARTCYSLKFSSPKHRCHMSQLLRRTESRLHLNLCRVQTDKYKLKLRSADLPCRLAKCHIGSNVCLFVLWARHFSEVGNTISLFINSCITFT